MLDPRKARKAFHGCRKNGPLVVEIFKTLGSNIRHVGTEPVSMTESINYLSRGGREITDELLRDCSALFGKHYQADLAKCPDAILHIPASTDMERTGNIWDPEAMLVDEKTGLVYRRERFEAGVEMPIELIVTDRRFYPDELRILCEREGLKVCHVYPVGLGSWDTPIESADVKAKEIVCIGTFGADAS
ncbi:hypothetical protein ACO2JO_19095 [Leptospira interrogans]